MMKIGQMASYVDDGLPPVSAALCPACRTASRQ
jgi:hypothetical protein